MNMQVKIESGIPVPDGAGGRPRKYPFAQMDVGDSFAIPDDGKRNKRGQSIAANRLTSAAHDWAKNNNTSVKFTRRRVIEDGKPVFRIWRFK